MFYTKFVGQGEMRAALQFFPLSPLHLSAIGLTPENLWISEQRRGVYREHTPLVFGTTRVLV
jgi:hypothetical protein